MSYFVCFTIILVVMSSRWHFYYNNFVSPIPDIVTNRHTYVYKRRAYCERKRECGTERHALSKKTRCFRIDTTWAFSTDSFSLPAFLLYLQKVYLFLHFILLFHPKDRLRGRGFKSRWVQFFIHIKKYVKATLDCCGHKNTLYKLVVMSQRASYPVWRA